MQNPSVTFTCHVCGTVDEGQRAKAKEAGDGTAEDGVTPALLSRLSRDGHFSLQNYLVIHLFFFSTSNDSYVRVSVC